MQSAEIFLSMFLATITIAFHDLFSSKSLVNVENTIQPLQAFINGNTRRQSPLS